VTAHVNAKIFKVEAPQPQNQGGKFIRPLLYTVKPRFYRIATESNPPCTANSCHFQYTNVTDCWLSYIYCSQIHSISTVVDNSQSTSYLCRISRKNEKKSPRLKSDIWSSFACDRKLEAVLCCVSVCLSVCLCAWVCHTAGVNDRPGYVIVFQVTSKFSRYKKLITIRNISDKQLLYKVQASHSVIIRNFAHSFMLTAAEHACTIKMLKKWKR